MPERNQEAPDLNAVYTTIDMHPLFCRDNPRGSRCFRQKKHSILFKNSAAFFFFEKRQSLYPHIRYPHTAIESPITLLAFRQAKPLRQSLAFSQIFLGFASNHWNLKKPSEAAPYHLRVLWHHPASETPAKWWRFPRSNPMHNDFRRLAFRRNAPWSVDSHSFSWSPSAGMIPSCSAACSNNLSKRNSLRRLWSLAVAANLLVLASTSSSQRLANSFWPGGKDCWLWTVVYDDLHPQIITKYMYIVM